MNSSARRGEADYFQERTERIFQKGIYWYFRTREEVIIGPFDSSELAIKGASDYVDFASGADPALLGTLGK